jgi:hypothetical protein
MALFSYTTLNPTTNATVTVDSGKLTLDKAFRDIRAYCKRNGYPLPSKDQIINHAKPTPGPWDCDGVSTMYATPHESDAMTMLEIRANVTDDGWDTVAFIEAIWPGAAANARLIAAAPELLESGEGLHFAMVDLLKAYAAVQEHYGLKPEDSPIYRAAREANRKQVAALDKATGKAA